MKTEENFILKTIWGEKQSVHFRRQMIKKQSIRNVWSNERLDWHFWAFHCVTEELQENKSGHLEPSGVLRSAQLHLKMQEKQLYHLWP